MKIAEDNKKCPRKSAKYTAMKTGINKTRKHVKKLARFIGKQLLSRTMEFYPTIVHLNLAQVFCRKS